jgi:uncharacterized damage-inducible protein DinB/predicted N-acetyltransferase YhbS
MNVSMAATLRPVAPGDDLHAITALLNRAYAPLAAAGMNFSAASQDVATTRERMAAGDSFVMEDETGVCIATVTLSRPRDPQRQPWAAEHPWICAPDIAHVNQFAVEPALQRAGLGARLMAHCEQAARARGAARIVLDTAEPATHLRAWYERLGYHAIGADQWPGKAYRSVVYEKWLPRSPMKTQLLTMARYNAWATAKLFEHVDALPEAQYRRDCGLFFKSVHGTLNHLLVTEHCLWRRRFAEGLSPKLALDAEVQSDRAALKAQLFEGAAAWPPLIEGWSDERLAGTLDYNTSKGVPMSLPFAATLNHVFNHGTHHRGQITAGLTAMGHPCPEIDLVWMLQKQAARPAPLAPL